MPGLIVFYTVFSTLLLFFVCWKFAIKKDWHIVAVGFGIYAADAVVTGLILVFMDNRTKPFIDNILQGLGLSLAGMLLYAPFGVPIVLIACLVVSLILKFLHREPKGKASV